MNTIKYASLFLLISGLALPACASKNRNSVAKLENEQVQERIIESETNASEEPCKEDLVQGL